MNRFGFSLERPLAILDTVSEDDNAIRAATVFVERWLEQLRTSFVPRRVRTLSACGALEELLALAESYVKSGGVTRPAIDPEESGHGVRMLEDVAKEAADVLCADEVMKSAYPKRKSVLYDLVQKMAARENVTQQSVEQLRALTISVKRTALQDGFDLCECLVTHEPKRHESLCSLSESLVSELRSRGWSDDALLAAGEAVRASISSKPVQALRDLRSRLTVEPRDFICYVPVVLPPNRPPFPKDDPTIELVEALPTVPQGRPVKRGPYLRAKVAAFDPHSAATLTYRRALSTLGALTVFLKTGTVDVAGDIVAVEDNGSLRNIELQNRLVEEKRKVEEDQQLRIVSSAWRASASTLADPLHDALRLRHRAMLAQDADSRLLLLWSSMERLTAGARGYQNALSATKDLVSHAVALGKLRRDVGDLAAVFSHTVRSDPEKQQALKSLLGAQSNPSHLDRTKVLALLLGDEATLRQLTTVVYDTSPLLAYRCHLMWKALGAGKAKSRGQHVAEYLEASRLRVARQVGRIYRARNRIAHVGVGPERVHDLVWHSHFYLTQLVAICVHYTENREERSQYLLQRRAGQFQALIAMLKAEDESAKSPEMLLRPTRLVKV